MVVVFPAPFGPRNPDHLAGASREGHVVDGQEFAVPLREALGFDQVVLSPPAVWPQPFMKISTAVFANSR